jgi:hypothetical protein
LYRPFSHARHGKPELGGRHLRLAPADARARANASPALVRSVMLALEFGERGEDAEDELAGGRRRVDRRALAG